MLLLVNFLFLLKLLDHESKASEQVQLLLKLDENKPALLKAIESGDTDLVYMVILRLRDNMPLADFKVKDELTFS